MKNRTLILTIIIVLTLIAMSCNLQSIPSTESQGPQPVGDQPQTPQSPPPTFPPPATSEQQGQPTDQPPQPTEQPEFFKFIQTVQVTPDQNYPAGGFPRIHYVPATDSFVVTFATDNYKPASLPVTCQGGGIAYKEYSTEMQETGKSGRIIWDPAVCQAGDMGDVMVDNDFYAVWRAPNWQLIKLNAVSWEKLAEITIPLDSHTESPGDPMVAYVNGQIDISSGYNLTGKPHNDLDPAGTYGTHHHLFSTDLESQGEKILTEPGHIVGSSMVFVDGIYYLVTADNYFDDVVVAKYDKDWKYLGEKTLIKQANFSTGLVYDDGRFYVAYADTSQRTEPGFLPVYVNIHLAAFDRDWNLLEDLAVTNYTVADNMQTGHPWVILHGNRLYISYDVDTRDPVTHEERAKGQSVVSVYELTR